MDLFTLWLIAGVVAWVALGAWAETRFRRQTEGRDFKRKIIFYTWEKLETDDPVVRRAHRLRSLIVYGSFAVIVITLMVFKPHG